MRFSDLIGAMTFRQYCRAFGTLWLEREDGSLGYKPWPFWEGQDGEPGQLDVADTLQDCQVFWTPKARRKGISEIVSLYIKYTLEKEGKADAAVFSAGSRQAKEFMEKAFKRKVEGCEALYPDIPWPKWEIGRDRAECETGSYLQLYSSDNAGARGAGPRFTFFDEAREYGNKDFRDMLASIFPVLRGRNQLAIVSSGSPGSPFNERIDYLRKALPSPRKSVWRSENGKTGMVFLNDFLDPDHRDPAWRKTELEERFAGDTVRFNSEYPPDIDSIFQSHEGLVYPSWNEKKHIAEQKVIWEPQHEFYIFHDQGSSQAHPAVTHFCQYDPYIDFFYIFDEVFERGMELSNINKKIVAKIRYWRMEWDREGQKVKPAIKAYGDVRGLSGARHVGDIMREETGLNFVTVHKRDKDGSLELAKARFYRGGIVGGVRERGGIALSGRCHNSIKQISSLRYKVGKDEPEDMEDDASDLIRYESYEAYIRPPTPPPTYEEKQLQRVKEFQKDARKPSVPGMAVESSWLTMG